MYDQASTSAVLFADVSCSDGMQLLAFFLVVLLIIGFDEDDKRSHERIKLPICLVA